MASLPVFRLLEAVDDSKFERPKLILLLTRKVRLSTCSSDEKLPHVSRHNLLEIMWFHLKEKLPSSRSLTVWLWKTLESCGSSYKMCLDIKLSDNTSARIGANNRHRRR